MGEQYIVGFTGARSGMTKAAEKSIRRHLVAAAVNPHIGEIVGLHGDCVGADADFDRLCEFLGVPRWQRPCTMHGEADHVFRAHTGAEVIAEPTNPMARNREIAKQCDVLFAVVPTRHELKKGSGTWATYRYGRKYGKRVVLFFPNGDVEVVEPGAVRAESVD